MWTSVRWQTLVLVCVTLHATYSTQAAVKRDDCQTQTVASGDSCGSLASKCSISSDQFNQYNPQQDLCSSLTPGQRVCCTAGTLPDITPKQNSDGSCASYQVKSDDTCSTIAVTNGLQPSDISTFNDGTTWGWTGCDELMADLAICLSTGTPPMPAQVPNAVCGPIKPGDQTMPPSGNLTDMNPCPLNACCNVWGQCGITPDYCTPETGPTGNPGTAPDGKNGCISNCGTDIANNQQGPQTFTSIAYYESWNWDRPCLNMRPDSINQARYTHVHWSFAQITDSWDVSINDTYNQFPVFLGLTRAKRIVSFGGWGYSTDPSTYDILRNAMDPSNAGTFIDNVVNFVNQNNLDGVDFDWEYPGAPDIPGIPAGLDTDTSNYLAFLQQLRQKIPQGKSISIAAPASYWYLKPFPIADMAKELDYIVYMTYDLHGQWDYNSAWSQDGCPAGNCLRSHVNLTETNYALAMITKAGVPSNKINVGVSSYGRAFGMSQAGCTGPMCTMGGPDSTATPGDCTATAGYISNAEIYDILFDNDTDIKPTTWYDTDSNSDIMVYSDTQWVSFMSQTTKDSRTGFYKGLNFAGVVDWAVDLQDFTDDDGNPNGDDDDDEDLPDLGPLPDCDASYNTMEDLDAAAGDVPPNCAALYLAATLSKVLDDSMNKYNDMMNNGYDDKFKTYASAVADSAGSSVRDFVNNNGNTYFTCQVGEYTTCCDYCHSNYPANQCAYCFTGTCYQECNDAGCTSKRGLESDDLAIPEHEFNSSLSARDRISSQQEPIAKGVKEDEPCPPDYSKRGQGPDNPYEQSVWWNLNADKSDQFYADLLTATGVPKDKIDFEQFNRGNDCAPSAKPDDDCWMLGIDYGMPTPKGYGTADVTNPKDLVQKALSNSQNLQSQLANVIIDMQCDSYLGDAMELVDAISLPILMISDAVDSMAQVDATAQKIDDEKKKAFILAFIGAILFFVPIAGEALGTVVELGDITTIISILGAAGSVAMDVYTIIKDPENAPLAIFDLILAPLAIADVAVIAKVAGLRRGMADADIAKLGGKIGGRMGTIKKFTGVCVP